MLREEDVESEELIRMAENETKGMDFTFIVDQLQKRKKGNEDCIRNSINVTENQPYILWRQRCRIAGSRQEDVL